MTFSLVTARIAEVGLLKEYKPKSFPRMALARKTLNTWMEHQPTTKLKITPSSSNYGLWRTGLSTWLRVVLFPNNVYQRGKNAIRNFSLKKSGWEDTPDVHYIDNFDLRYQRNPKNAIRRVQVSFLLPQNHGLERTHSGIIVDLVKGSIVYDFGPIEGISTLNVFLETHTK